MALILFIVLPIGWAIAGRLLGTAASLSVPTPAGQRIGRALGWWCMWLLPTLYCPLVFLGLSGNAGSGVRLFGPAALSIRATLLVP